MDKWLHLESQFGNFPSENKLCPEKFLIKKLFLRLMCTVLEVFEEAAWQWLQERFDVRQLASHKIRNKFAFLLIFLTPITSEISDNRHGHLHISEFFEYDGSAKEAENKKFSIKMSSTNVFSRYWAKIARFDHTFRFHHKRLRLTLTEYSDRTKNRSACQICRGKSIIPLCFARSKIFKQNLIFKIIPPLVMPSNSNKFITVLNIETPVHASWC